MSSKNSKDESDASKIDSWTGAMATKFETQVVLITLI